MAKRRKPKRAHQRDGNPANHNNWVLVCGACGARFPETESIDLQQGHFATDHPDLDTPHFNLVWQGRGPAPKAPVRHQPRRF